MRLFINAHLTGKDVSSEQERGLIDAIDERLHLLKRHLPYHESDHVLNIAYNILTGGTRLDDIELRRNDERYMNALGAEPIPDPTTAGDFRRRFSHRHVWALMEVANRIRPKVWKRCLRREERRRAVIDADGVVSPPRGECKEGMDMAYNGLWAYHVLLVSLANTMEPLYLVNRSGNRPSHEGAAAWTGKAWFALLVRGREKRTGLLRMEFRRFLNAVMRVPCQIVRTGRRIVYRMLGYTEWTGVFLRTFDVIRSLRFP